MSQIKISELPILSTISSNTSNTLFAGVAVETGVTGQMTAKTLAHGLYTNEVLNVGTNPVDLPNTVAQFALGGDSYIQTNLVNTNAGGTADYVVTANNGTDSTYFIDMGLANQNYVPGSEFNNIGTSINPLDGYLYVQGLNSSSPGGNLIVGTTTANTEMRVIAGGGNSANIVAKFTNAGFKMVNGRQIYFDDGTSQNTAAATLAYSQAAFASANTNANNIATQALVDLTQNTSITTIQGVDVTQNTSIQAAFNKANNALANTSGTFAGNLTITGNVIVNGTNLNGDTATFTGVINPQKGFVYTPRLPVGDQTAITVNYATDSMIKANLVADLTISHSNFTTGKVVEVWLINSSGSQRTITHGVSALNSTVNSTTFNIPATSLAHLKFLSIDGDLANTVVTITRA